MTAANAPRLELVAAQYEDEEGEGVREGWAIDSVSTADWALMRLGALEREVEENEAICAERIRELEEKTKRLNSRAQKGIEFFRMALATYAEQNRDVLLGGGKKKSRALPHGRIGWRTKPGCLKTKDVKALLAWAQQQPAELQLVRFEEKPCLDAIKAHAEEAQMMPPGMEWEPEVETLVVEVTK